MARANWELLTRSLSGGKQSYHSIDLVRGLAALAVLVVHYHHFFAGGTDAAIAHDRIVDVPFYSNGFLRWIYHHGSNAVQLFWTISGFVFMHVYAGRRATLTLRTYFVNRFARLYPLHFVTLVVVVLLQAVSMAYLGRYLIYGNNDVYHFILQLFFASEWGLQAGRSFNGPIWSVSLEVLIYLTFFLYIKAFRVNLLTAGIVLVLFSVAYLRVKNQAVLCGIYFFAGVVGYAFYELSASLSKPVRMGLAFGVLASSVVLVFMTYSYGLKIPRSMVLAPLFLSVIAGMAILEDVLGEEALLFAKPVGDLTYSSYLWHSPLQMVFLLLTAAGMVPIGVIFQAWFFPCYIAFICVFSLLSYRFIERPAQRFFRGVMLPARKSVVVVVEG